MESSNVVYGVVKEILLHRFPNIPEKQVIKKTNRGLKFACPYCGDSIEDATKHRGNLYLNSKSYKCWNAGCFKFTSMAKFISEYSLEYNIDISTIDLDFDMAWDKSKIQIAKGVDNPIVKYLKDVGDFDKLLHISFFTNNMGLIPITQLHPQEENINSFLQRRYLREGYNFSDVMFFDYSFDKLYTFNLHIQTGKVLGFSYRLINRKEFKIYTYDTMADQMGVAIEFEDNSAIIELGNYFNCLNVNFNKTVALTEAQLDSIFINNCIAIQGVSKMHFFIEYFTDYEFHLMFDDDQSGIAEMLKDAGVNLGFIMWSKIKHDLKKTHFDLIRDIMKIKDINDLYIFLRTVYNLDVIQFQKFLEKYISKDGLDLFFL